MPMCVLSSLWGLFRGDGDYLTGLEEEGLLRWLIGPPPVCFAAEQGATRLAATVLMRHLVAIGIPAAAASDYERKLDGDDIDTVELLCGVSADELGSRYGFDSEGVAAVVRYRAGEVRAALAARRQPQQPQPQQ
jgi:hypothetical protein